MSSHESSEHIYTFTVGPANAQDITFDTCGSGFDVTLLVANDQGSVISAQDEDNCGGSFNAETLDVTLNPGNYYVVIEGFGGAEGPYTLTTTCVSASPTSAPTSASPTFSPTSSEPTTSPSESPTSSERPHRRDHLMQQRVDRCGVAKHRWEAAELDIVLERRCSHAGASVPPNRALRGRGGNIQGCGCKQPQVRPVMAPAPAFDRA